MQAGVDYGRQQGSALLRKLAHGPIVLPIVTLTCPTNGDCPDLAGLVLIRLNCCPCHIAAALARWLRWLFSS